MHYVLVCLACWSALHATPPCMQVLEIGYNLVDCDLNRHILPTLENQDTVLFKLLLTSFLLRKCNQEEKT